jgi:hypothetical protein
VTEPLPPVLSPKEAAKLCRCSVATLYRAGVPYVELTAHKRVFLLENVLAWLKQRAA